MKRILLPAAALLILALALGGCTADGDKIIVTDPPRVTSNVTSSPAPVTPTHAPTPAITPDGPDTGSHPDEGGGLTNGNGIDGSGSDNSSGSADNSGLHPDRIG